MFFCCQPSFLDLLREDQSSACLHLMLRLIATALSTDKTTTTFQEELRKAISVENPQFLQVSAVYVGTISGAVTGVVVIHELYKL